MGSRQSGHVTHGLGSFQTISATGKQIEAGSVVTRARIYSSS